MVKFLFPAKYIRILVCSFLAFLAICLFSSKNFVSHTESTRSKIFNLQLVQRLEIVEKELEILKSESKKESIETVFEISDNGNMTLNDTLTTNSFWYGDHDVEKYDDMYKSTNKNHSTCLVSNITCKHSYKLLILITTHTSHFQRRQSIRETWGKDTYNRWKTYFLVGRSNEKDELKRLNEEIKSFDDIILGNVIENFYKLTYKVQAGFEWSIRYCDYEYLLKGDDDVFVNIPNLYSFLNNQLSAPLYAGFVQYHGQVLRTGRYGVPEHEFKGKKYPPYCSGGGFIVSRSAVTLMFNVFNEVNVIRIDDAYIGILAAKARVGITHEMNFRMNEKQNNCFYSNTTIIQHPVKNPECMKKMFHANLKDISSNGM